jgi:phosphoenolpyruvate-protein kinase (PTS system EI component)
MVMFVLHGKSLAGGVAIGRARVLSTGVRDAPRRRIAPAEVATELQRLDDAIARVQADERRASPEHWHRRSSEF